MSTFPITFDTETASNAKEIRLNGFFTTNDGWSQFETVKSGEAYYLPSAQQIYVASAAATDDSADTGARKIIIYGLDSNHDEISETVTMNGTTPVLTSSSFIRVFSAIVSETGSTRINEGKISIAKEVGMSNILLTIELGANASTDILYTVPDGYVFYVESILTGVYAAESNPGVSSDHTLIINRKTSPGVETFVTSYQSTNSVISESGTPLLTFYAKEDVKLFYSMENATQLHITVSGLLVNVAL